MNIRVKHTKTLEFSTDNDEISIPILFEFKFLYSGWELDEVGCIVEFCGNKRLVASDHGTLYLVPENEAISFLEGFLFDYKNAIENTNKALSFLT
jgi:hypothetical protein